MQHSTANQQVIEEIIVRASGDVSLLCGAGASAAATLPTMTSFLEKAYGTKFVERIEGKAGGYQMGSDSATQQRSNRSTLLRQLFHAANLGRDEFSYDLEVLFEFIHTSPLGDPSWAASGANNHFLWMFHQANQGANHDFPRAQQVFGDYTKKLKTWLNDANETVADLRKRLYDSFLIKRDSVEILERAKVAYKPLLDKLFSSQPPVVFTLNFDTIFEALEDSELLDYGLADGISPAKRSRYFDFENFLGVNNPMYLFKLHGSVTWFRESKGIRDTFPGPPPTSHDGLVAVAEPVLSKNPEETPFVEMYSILRGVLERNRVCVAIGLSFRDDALRSAVEDRIDDGLHLVLVAPEDDKYPELSTHLKSLDARPNVTWLKERFGDDQTNEKIVEAVRAAQAAEPSKPAKA